MTSIARHLSRLEPLPPLTTVRPERWLRGYRGYQELLNECTALAGRGAREECLGFTVEGEPIFALELGEPEAPRLSILLAGLHAMEWIGVEIALRIITRIASSPPSDRRVLCVPVANIDGFRRVESNLRDGRRRFVRTNSRRVDLNRNWPTHYRKLLIPGKLLPWLGSSGDHARSEPEADAICAHLDAELERGTSIDFALSLHSIGRMLLLPYGGRFRRPGTYADHLASAEVIRKNLAWRYRVIQVSRWLPGFFAFGMEIDHLLEGYGARSLLVECSRGGTTLRDPSSWFEPFRWYNPQDPDEEGGALAEILTGFLCPG